MVKLVSSPSIHARTHARALKRASVPSDRRNRSIDPNASRFSCPSLSSFSPQLELSIV